MALALAMLVASCAGPDGSDAAPPSHAGQSGGTPPVAETTTPTETVAQQRGPDARGVIAPHPTAPQVDWMLAATDLDLAVDQVTFHDPRYPPMLDGWPMVGMIAVGEVWVVGAADVASDRRWLVVLDPTSGEQVATMGVTRGDGPPSSCTGALAGGAVACLYGDTLEVLDPAAGSATGRVVLAAPAHSVHVVDGDVLVLGVADDGTAVELTRVTPAGEQVWSVAAPLDAEESLAMTGNYVPVVQEAPGLVLVGVGALQLAVDAATGAIAWQGIADVLAVGPDGGLVASAVGDQAWGTPSRLERLDATATVSLGTDELGWRPAAANSGLVPGPIVTDDGDGVVGVRPDGGHAWRLEADPDELRVPMVRADGVVVLQDTAGVMTAIEPENGDIRWRNDAGSSGWTTRGWDALSDGERMVVRSPEGIIAVDLTDGSLVWEVRVPGGDGRVWELVDLGRGVVAAGERTLRAYLGTAG
ncbi:PQQ-binding-like beta-propeller repeat protein [Georgenia sp. MJ170]|uniref:outer membrane protein assembly factor BamB family protein n=1 Tax=Georgenia sunbinii TaxID=3117728 RepID=UPI002F2630E0